MTPTGTINLRSGRKNAKNPHIALNADHSIGVAKSGLIHTRFTNIVVDHLHLDASRNIAAGILQQRYQIIGAMTGFGVLKVDDPDFCNALPFRQPEQILLGPTWPLEAWNKRRNQPEVAHKHRGTK